MFKDALHKALADLPESNNPELLSQLAAHWTLVRQWNDRCNLTSISDPEDAAWLHYRDSLQALSLLQAGPVLDIGSGAGFPGIPLALARPNWQFTLMEPRNKRASFLKTVISRLGMRNIQVLVGRSEDPLPVDLSHSESNLFAAAVTRATFSSQRDLYACLRWIRPGGKLIAYRSDEAVGRDLNPENIAEDRGSQHKSTPEQRTSLALGGCQLYAYLLRTTHRNLAVWNKP